MPPSFCTAEKQTPALAQAGQPPFTDLHWARPQHFKGWLLSGGELREGSIHSLPISFLHWKLPIEQIVKSTWKVSNLSSLRDYFYDLGLLTKGTGHRCTHHCTRGIIARAFLGFHCASSNLLPKPGSHCLSGLAILNIKKNPTITSPQKNHDEAPKPLQDWLLSASTATSFSDGTFRDTWCHSRD